MKGNMTTKYYDRAKLYLNGKEIKEAIIDEIIPDQWNNIGVSYDPKHSVNQWHGEIKCTLQEGPGLAEFLEKAEEMVLKNQRRIQNAARRTMTSIINKHGGKIEFDDTIWMDDLKQALIRVMRHAQRLEWLETPDDPFVDTRWDPSKLEPKKDGLPDPFQEGIIASILPRN